MLTIMAYFDESGKFQDHGVVALGGVMCSADGMDPFFEEWHGCLYQNGLALLTMKEALRHDRPLSAKNPAPGIKARTDALLPFIECIRRHLWIVSGIALDVNAFKNLPSHCHQILGDDPFFTAFLRTLLQVIDFAKDDDKLMMVCDDEEQMALPMYRLYRRVKLIFPEAREKLRALCFGDDQWMHALQAADLVSSILRRQADKQFFQTEYDYEPLFSALTRQPDRAAGEKIWACGFSFADKAMLLNLAESLRRDKESNG